MDSTRRITASAAAKDRLSLSWSQSLDVDYANANRASMGGDNSQEASVRAVRISDIILYYSHALLVYRSLPRRAVMLTLVSNLPFHQTKDLSNADGNLDAESRSNTAGRL